MHTIRRGVLAAGAPAAWMSSRGSASETPAARRKVRRFSFMGESLKRLGFLFGVVGGGKASFRLKHPALDNLMDQGAESVLLLANDLHDPLDLGLAHGLQGGAGGVGQQLLGQGAGELILVF